MSKDLSQQSFESVKARERHFVQQISVLQAETSALLSQNASNMLGGFVENLELFSFAGTRLSSNPEIAKRQKEGIETLTTTVRSIKQDLLEELALLDERPVPTFPEFDAIHVTTAVYTYASEIRIGWAFALACDMLPALFILLSVFGVNPSREEPS
ncbi:MAG: hypothetical protein VX730_03360 [Pseudomonadota bacterium]|nr:hypothetical protein [Pseudomonadota bacterium]